MEFQGLFDGRITEKSMADQWEAVQRISATIQYGRTRASQIIRKVSAFNRKHSLFKGLRNLGRLVRTRHILEVAGDREYRKRILPGLNKGESRNALAKDLPYRPIMQESEGVALFSLEINHQIVIKNQTNFAMNNRGRNKMTSGKRITNRSTPSMGSRMIPTSLRAFTSFMSPMVQLIKRHSP